MSTTVESPAPASTPVVVTNEANDRPRSNILGIVALGLAILGFIFAALLLTAGIAWLLLLPALVLGVVGLILPYRRKGAALAAVIIAVMAFILSFVGFRLPTDSAQGMQVLNNDGVNPASGVMAGLFGGGQNPAANGTTGAAGADGGLAVDVNSVDCHTPLASVTGLNITGEVCAVSVAITNNGTTPIDVDSSSVTATSDGTGYLADAELGVGDALSAHVGVGESTVGTVYVNLPSGTTDIDALTISTGDLGADVTVDLGN